MTPSKSISHHRGSAVSTVAVLSSLIQRFGIASMPLFLRLGCVWLVLGNGSFIIRLVPSLDHLHCPISQVSFGNRHLKNGPETNATFLAIMADTGQMFWLLTQPSHRIQSKAQRGHEVALQPRLTHLAWERATLSAPSLTSSLQSPDSPLSVVMLLGMGSQPLAYASVSITSGGAFTAISICTVVMGKVFTVFLIV